MAFSRLRPYERMLGVASSPSAHDEPGPHRLLFFHLRLQRRRPGRCPSDPGAGETGLSGGFTQGPRSRAPAHDCPRRGPGRRFGRAPYPCLSARRGPLSAGRATWGTPVGQGQGQSDRTLCPPAVRCPHPFDLQHRHHCFGQPRKSRILRAADSAHVHAQAVSVRPSGHRLQRRHRRRHVRLYRTCPRPYSSSSEAGGAGGSVRRAAAGPRSSMVRTGGHPPHLGCRGAVCPQGLRNLTAGLCPGTRRAAVSAYDPGTR